MTEQDQNPIDDLFDQRGTELEAERTLAPPGAYMFEVTDAELRRGQASGKRYLSFTLGQADGPRYVARMRVMLEGGGVGIGQRKFKAIGWEWPTKESDLDFDLYRGTRFYGWLEHREFNGNLNAEVDKVFDKDNPPVDIHTDKLPFVSMYMSVDGVKLQQERSAELAASDPFVQEVDSTPF